MITRHISDKTEIVQTRLSKTDVDKLDYLSTKNKTSRADFIRRILLQHIENTFSEEDKKSLERIYTDKKRHIKDNAGKGTSR